MKSHDIIAALRRSYCQPEWAIFTEVADGTGANSRRRADAIAMNMWPSRGLELRAFEVKVSRSDLAGELRDPAKAEAFAQYCNTFYLVTPKGLSKGMDIPHNWGLIEVHDNGKAIVKRQSEFNKNPAEMTKSFVAGLVRAASKSNESEIKAQLRHKEEELRVAAEERIKSGIDRALEVRRGKVAHNEELLAKMIEVMGKDALRLLHDSNFLATVKTVHELGIHSNYKGFGRMRKDLEMVRTIAIAMVGQIDEHVVDLGGEKPDEEKEEV